VGQIPGAEKVNQMTDTRAPGSLNGATASRSLTWKR
jgi:hypothetical protein